MTRTRYLIVLTPILAVWACSVEQPENRLEQAAQELQQATQDRNEALRELADAQEELRAERAEVQTAEKALQQARRQLRARRKELVGEQQDLQVAASDTAIFRLLQRRLLDASELDDVAVTARVYERQVTLYGEVAEQSQRDAAQRIAESVPGVAAVSNLIDVSGQ